MEEPLFADLFKVLGCEVKTDDDILALQFEGSTLRNKDVIVQLYEFIPKFKSKYKSNALTCLHKNSIEKQKFPAVNFMRQILKCNGFKLKGHYISNGYNKKTGQKILKRIYNITKLEN